MSQWCRNLSIHLLKGVALALPTHIDHSELTESEAADSLRRVVRRYAETTPIDHPDFGFYWSRKSDGLAGMLLSEFLPQGGLSLDPFLGSGSSVVGASRSPHDHRMIGVEINQMPLEVLRGRLEISQIQISNLKATLEEFANEHGDLFKYTNEHGEDFELSSVRFDREQGHIVPLEFTLVNNVTSKILKISEGSFFQELSAAYVQRESQCLELLVHLPDLMLMPNSRIAIKQGMKISDIFTTSNFLVLSRMRTRIASQPELALLMASCLHQCRITDRGSQSQFPFWVPSKNAVSKNPFLILRKKLRQMERSLQELAPNILEKDNSAFVTDFNALANSDTKVHMLIHSPTQSVTKEQIPDETIDFVLTDPPYYDQVAYSEYLAIWEFFCQYSTNLRDEVVMSNRKEHAANRNDYLRLLHSAMKNVSRMMKHHSYAAIYFKDSKISNIWDFLTLMESCGLVFISLVHVSKNSYTYKQNTSQDNTVSGDAIYLFRKTNHPEFKKAALVRFDLEDLRSCINDYLVRHPQVKYTQILDECIIPTLWFHGARDLFASQDTIAEFFQMHYSTDRNSRNVTTR
jgi:DNA modification methylase